MELPLYYDKMRAEVKRLGEEFPIIVSLESGSGRKPGQLTEVKKENAARLLVQGLAKLATPEEAAAFRQAQAEMVSKAAEELAASKIPLSLLPTAMLDNLKRAAKLKG